MPRLLEGLVLGSTLCLAACGARTGLPGVLDDGAVDSPRDTTDLDLGTDLGFDDAVLDSSVDVAADTAPLCPDGAVDAGSPLADLREGMLGRWIGVAESPWSAPYRVEITFTAAGGYSAHCLDVECTAFYYGVDADDPKKRYEVYDVKAGGEGFARIEIGFGGGSTARGALERIFLRDSGRRLTFEFFPTWLGHIGPVTYDLRRDCL